MTTSGCGTVIKDYGFMLREDRDFAASAAKVSALAKDITEYLAGLDLQPSQQRSDIVVAYHSACSLQHGQKITQAPKELLSKNGFVVKDVPESHLCCGSAGTYNILSLTLRTNCAIEGRQYCDGQAGHDCCGQYWMHGADCQWYVGSRGSHS